MQIKILGVENNRRKDLEKMVKKCLAKLSLPQEVKVVGGIDEILQYDIAGIPAVLVEDKVLFEAEIPKEERIYQKLAIWAEKIALRKSVPAA